MTARTADVLLVGAGAMSSTLGVLLKQLDPSMKIIMVERLDHVAQESTDGWNNAGTGHAAYCELNYTPKKPDGSIDTTKAFNINSAFEQSLQFWSYLVEQNALPDPAAFINTAPHCSFVWGEENVAFLRERHRVLSAHPMFADMEYSEDPEVITQWMPLVMRDRPAGEKVAATRVPFGSDVNFGDLSRLLVEWLGHQPDFDLMVAHNVNSLTKQPDGRWLVQVQNKADGHITPITANFVFLGAGGGALPLLQKTGIAEGHGYGGFPVSGQWLVCTRPEIVEQHHAKVYGKAPIGAPPMSVPHLDTRIINGKKSLLFGPFAGFTTKFLKYGSYTDLFKSVRLSNLGPMMSVGMRNMDLTRYLISESLQSHESRVKSLRNFFPNVSPDDWELSIAGQRVQIIKKDPKGGGKLEFGTEVIVSADGTMSALLGASPGASTAVQAMLTILERSFAEKLKTPEWQTKIKEMIPSYGESLIENADLLKQVRQRTLKTLKLGA